MKIENRTNETGGVFSAMEGDDLMGQMSYVFAGPDMFIIDHTSVGAAYSGEGVGTELVNAAVDYAREKNYKIFPTCSFARAVFIKDESLHDVLAKQA